MDDTDDLGAAIASAAATVRAPHGLRERVARRREQAGRRRRTAGLLGVAATVLAATVLVLALTLPGDDQPTVAAAARLALAEPTSGPPGTGDSAGELDVAVGGIAFPDWSDDGWEAVGQREGQVAGRPARVVTYEDDAGRRVGYAIVDGEPLLVPDGEARDLHGTQVTLVDGDEGLVAAWEVGGHTCVLATEDVGDDVLVRMAAWTVY